MKNCANIAEVTMRAARIYFLMEHTTTITEVRDLNIWLSDVLKPTTL